MEGSTALSTHPHPVLTAILVGGFIGGSIDIGSAALINWLSPVIILHAIASGVLGKESFQGGAAAALLGLFLQWGMALLIAAIYVLASRKLKWMNRHWEAAGIAYGAVVYVVMTYVVVPLSAAPFGPKAFQLPLNFVNIGENLLAMILFGLIIAAAARYFLGQPAPGTRPIQV
jgi:uncharacterized membrane protein YagU involved in acid resistance